MWAETTQKKGANFTFTPLVRPARARETTQAAKPRPQGRDFVSNGCLTSSKLAVSRVTATAKIAEVSYVLVELVTGDDSSTAYTHAVRVMLRQTL